MIKCGFVGVSTHSRPKAAGKCDDFVNQVNKVSTHSRPKAAGTPALPHWVPMRGFNTQPPEGGWFGGALVFW